MKNKNLKKQELINTEAFSIQNLVRQIGNYYTNELKNQLYAIIINADLAGDPEQLFKEVGFAILDFSNSIINYFELINVKRYPRVIGQNKVLKCYDKNQAVAKYDFQDCFESLYVLNETEMWLITKQKDISEVIIQDNTLTINYSDENKTKEIQHVNLKILNLTSSVYQISKLDDQTIREIKEKFNYQNLWEDWKLFKKTEFTHPSLQLKKQGASFKNDQYGEFTYRPSYSSPPSMQEFYEAVINGAIKRYQMGLYKGENLPQYCCSMCFLSYVYLYQLSLLKMLLCFLL
ncbi:hypothetical protein IMG5_116410 [Ichthyophthirius multifiliis]|uniref:Uncharacterized protein n=1 Tax=Ichthyophthirius multifiliis TaxID=5932 RepID=G0QUD3_ICHMU|nr:hypothetical protein IMG5_116410 [Ichthyophthirius multifiliis]EGR31170.1 hypothetical protein IMG5_116410 [Ichthyophthirius multifiliis]|eukprot:XP_004034656.1 hypothetical protein IMG5_116410 [Ichthyophthirius multifiliis]